MTPQQIPPGVAPTVKCLLVDDLQENLLALSALLADHDVELLQARSGAEALELLLQHEIALALVDVQMPDMDGFELAELMRGSERTRDVPIIFVTAGVHDQYRQFRGYDSGAVDFLYKPVEPRILRHKAEVFFQLYRQRWQLAQELRERTEALRLTEMFMAVLGHDLRNPLHAILMSAELLKRHSDAELIQKTAARVLSSGNRMSRMIEDLLDLARARFGRGLELRREAVDLGGLLPRVLQEHDGAATPERLFLQLDGDLHGDWDGERLAQVLSNLIGNALRHGLPSAPVTVQLDGTHRDRVHLSVRNAGSIAPELLPQLFDPFRGERARGGRASGLGLGLYIAQQIVVAHGGSVEVQVPEAGMVQFSVLLPRRAV